MKRLLLVILLFVAGTAAFAQAPDMSRYLNEYSKANGTFSDRLSILESVRDARFSGIGDFYHEALKFFLAKTADIRTIEDRYAAERSARLLCQGLAAENYRAAAQELWQVVVFYDVTRDINNQGNEMQDALNALGEIGAVEFLPHIIQRLDLFNTRGLADLETRRRMQRGVVGCVNALEAFGDSSGYRPVFFVSIGENYDPPIRAIASNALATILDDPVDIISAIIQNPTNNPTIKFEAWRRMLMSGAPDSSIGKVATITLATSWNYQTSNVHYQILLREMRKNAIDTITNLALNGAFAVEDSVYTNLRRSYATNLVSNNPDYDEIQKSLNALTAIGTERSAGILFDFLRELHTRRRTGPWSVNKERQLFEWIIACLGSTGTQSREVRLLLTDIQRTADYTFVEQGWARDAIRQLGAATELPRAPAPAPTPAPSSAPASAEPSEGA